MRLDAQNLAVGFTGFVALGKSGLFFGESICFPLQTQMPFKNCVKDILPTLGKRVHIRTD